MEALPIVFIKNRVLHIQLPPSIGTVLHTGCFYFLRTPDYRLWDIKILARIRDGYGELYPFTLCANDPVRFLDEVCKAPEGKRKLKVIVDFLDANTAPVSGVPKLELHPI
ncbi:MAG: hypothetical protein P1P90_02680 [Patescibacteria group bacterium]|nr:hypothetical protein [Patescibacteria group bacterium]